MTRHSLIKISCLAIASLLLIFPSIDHNRKIVFDIIPPEQLNNARVVNLPDGSKGYSAADLTYQHTGDPFVADIAISFNYPPAKLKKDDSRKYIISEANYNFVKAVGSLGGGCAEFFKADHAIEIESGEGQWLGSCGDLGSFTIEFRLNPKKPDGKIFSRVSSLSGKKIGIEILIKNSSIVTVMNNFFAGPGGSRADAVIGGKNKIPLEKWAHFLLTYDRLSGKLAHRINGDETESRYMTQSGAPYNGAMTPTFGITDEKNFGEYKCLDSPDAEIGRGYTGMIDEFRISYKYFDDLEKTTEIAYKNYLKLQKTGRIPVNYEGLATSPVYDLAAAGTKVTNFSWKQTAPKDTFIWMEFRISDDKYTFDDNELKWYRINNGQRKIYLQKTDQDNYLRGRYCQWRAHLIPSPDGTGSPLLSQINMEYQIDAPPGVPRFLEVESSSGGRVVLKWRKSVEADLYGYKIYYGVYPDRYDGILTHVNGRRIDNLSATLDRSNDVRVIINNAVIEENRKLQRRSVLSYPPLHNTVLYYFAVSAYDSYKPDTVHNHESELSAPVSARPFSGSEIR